MATEPTENDSQGRAYLHGNAQPLLTESFAPVHRRMRRMRRIGHSISSGRCRLGLKATAKAQPPPSQQSLGTGFHVKSLGACYWNGCPTYATGVTDESRHIGIPWIRCGWVTHGPFVSRLYCYWTLVAFRWQMRGSQVFLHRLLH